MSGSDAGVILGILTIAAMVVFIIYYLKKDNCAVASVGTLVPQAAPMPENSVQMEAQIVIYSDGTRDARVCPECDAENNGIGSSCCVCGCRLNQWEGTYVL